VEADPVVAVEAVPVVADVQKALVMFSLIPMVMAHMMFVPEALALHIMCHIPWRQIQMYIVIADSCN